MYGFTAFVAGLVFAVGLIVSGMANRAKVLGSPDLAGKSDPSLAVVMAGAIAVGLAAFQTASRRKASLLGAEFRRPAPRVIDRRLVDGGVLFGIALGVAVFCPGAAVVPLGAGQMKALVFVAAMAAGMLLIEFSERAQRARAAS